jgi:hypothetical protein
MSLKKCLVQRKRSIMERLHQEQKVSDYISDIE